MSRLCLALLVLLTPDLAVPTATAGEGASDRRARAHRDTVVVEWNEVALEAVRRVRPGPPITARALAVVSTCVYDAWAAYDRKALATETGGTLRRPRHERTYRNKHEAVSVSAHMALVDLFPGERALFDEALREQGYEPGAPAGVESPADVARAACGAVLAFRHADGSNQLGDENNGAPYSDYTGYVPVNTVDVVTDPNRWQPITFSTGATPGFIAPHWGLVTPFALEEGDDLRPGPPAFHPKDEAYTVQAEALLRISANLTDRQKMIAEYWADGPSSAQPPGHWNLFAQFVSRRDRHGLDDDVRMFFAVNSALLDAGITSWECKRFYDYVRPFTALRFLFAGQLVEAWAGPGLGTQLIDGADWLPYQAASFITPPFAEYPSGHSTFSGAAAEVLRRFTGRDWFGMVVVLPRGSSFIEPGLTPEKPVVLFWPTFSAAADQAGLSRRYGGIHFRDGDHAGRSLGRQVGVRVWQKAEDLFDPGNANRHKTGPTTEP